MIGSMHGEKIEIIPARNAIRIVVCMVALYPYWLVLENFFFNSSVIVRVVIRRRIINAGIGDGYWVVVVVGAGVVVGVGAVAIL